MDTPLVITNALPGVWLPLVSLVWSHGRYISDGYGGLHWMVIATLPIADYRGAAGISACYSGYDYSLVLQYLVITLGDTYRMAAVLTLGGHCQLPIADR